MERGPSQEGAENRRRVSSKQRKSESRRPYGANWPRGLPSHPPPPPPAHLVYGDMPTHPPAVPRSLVGRSLRELPGFSDILHVTVPSGSAGSGWLASGVERQGWVGSEQAPWVWPYCTPWRGRLTPSLRGPSPPHRPATKVAFFGKRGLTWATGSRKPLRACCSLVCLEIAAPFGWAIEPGSAKAGKDFTLRCDCVFLFSLGSAWHIHV